MPRQTRRGTTTMISHDLKLTVSWMSIKKKMQDGCNLRFSLVTLMVIAAVFGLLISGVDRLTRTRVIICNSSAISTQGGTIHINDIVKDIPQIQPENRWQTRIKVSGESNIEIVIVSSDSSELRIEWYLSALSLGRDYLIEYNGKELIMH